MAVRGVSSKFDSELTPAHSATLEKYSQKFSSQMEDRFRENLQSRTDAAKEKEKNKA